MRADVKGYLPEAQCDLSGKKAECLLVSFDDGFPVDATLSIREFMKLVRLKAKQEGRSATNSVKPSDSRK